MLLLASFVKSETLGVGLLRSCLHVWHTYTWWDRDTAVVFLPRTRPMRFIFLQTHCPSKLLNVFTFIASCLSIECTNLNSNASFGKQFSRFWLAYGDLEMRKLFQGFLTQMQRGLRMADSNSKGNPETRWSKRIFCGFVMLKSRGLGSWATCNHWGVLERQQRLPAFSCYLQSMVVSTNFYSQTNCKRFPFWLLFFNWVETTNWIWLNQPWY